MLSAAARDDFGVRVDERVVALELGAYRVLEPWSSANCRVAECACTDRVVGGVAYRLPRRKVRLAGRKADDLDAFLLQLEHFRRHRERRRRLDARETARKARCGLYGRAHAFTVALPSSSGAARRHPVPSRVRRRRATRLP